MSAGAMSLLEVEDLRVTFRTETGPVEAVRGVSFALGRERLAIVGEFGQRQDDDRPRHPAADPGGAGHARAASPSTASTSSPPRTGRCAACAAGASPW